MMAQSINIRILRFFSLSFIPAGFICVSIVRYEALALGLIWLLIVRSICGVVYWCICWLV